MSTEAKVGAFIIAGLLALGGMILKLGDMTMKRRYPLKVVFSDVAGLPDKSVVKLSGVEVGKVRRIRLEGDQAVVDVAVNRGIDIYRDARFRIGSTSIIGSKFLQIDQGRAASGILAPGETVKGEVAQPLERLMADALKSVQNLLDDLHGTLGRQGSLTRNLEASTAHMRELTANMNDLIADAKPHLTSALERSDAVMEKLDELLAKSNELMARLNTSSGTVGALISDTGMKEDVKQTVANLRDASTSAKDVLGKFGQFRFYWSVTARNEPEVNATKGDIGLRIVPREGKYYYFGGSNLGSNASAAATNDFEPKNTVDAVMGWWGKWWEYYGGAIRSTFGVGGRLTPFPDDPLLRKVSFVGKAYDFGRNRTIFGKNFRNPQYDVGMELKVHKNLRLGARVEDIAEVQAYQTTANLMFEDRDIAYFFGLVSFSGSSRSASR